MWHQREITLTPKQRGVHLVTEELLHHLPDLCDIRVGLAHFFLQHTSASLALNENAAPDVRVDMERHLNLIAPDGAAHYLHRDEGDDDMAAHIKSVLVGESVTIPITDGRLNFGTWQGIYLLEHRDHGGARRIVVTITGEE
jgi:secondary thiamine-phosphate synthase enzyme